MPLGSARISTNENPWTIENPNTDDIRRINDTRREKKAHVTRLVHQITLHIVNRLRRTTLNSLKLQLKQATSKMEAINQTLCELTDPEDDEPERWIRDELNPVTE